MKQFAVAAIIAVNLMVGCGRTENDNGASTPRDNAAYTAPGPVASTTVADVMNQPARFDGQKVIISGEVSEVWAPRALTIEGEQFLENDTLLVVSREDLPRLARAVEDVLAKGDVVQVTGTIHVGPLPDIEREIAFDLPAAAEELWRPQEPILVAEQVIVTPRLVAP